MKSKTNLKFVHLKFEKCGKIEVRTEEVVNPLSAALSTKIQQSVTFPSAFIEKKNKKKDKGEHSRQRSKQQLQRGT